MTALREYCSKCSRRPILRARHCEYLAVNSANGGADVRNIRVYGARRYRSHRALYETIHRVTIHFMQRLYTERCTVHHTRALIPRHKRTAALLKTTEGNAEAD